MYGTTTYYYGIAVNGSYLYQGANNGSYYGIARTSISGKTRDDNFKEITEGTAFASINDICGDDTYLYLLTDTCVKKYSYLGVYQSEIALTGVYLQITSDGTNLYISNLSSVEVYTVSGTFVRSISENGIRAVAVKDGKLYIVTEENSGGGAT